MHLHCRSMGLFDERVRRFRVPLRHLVRSNDGSSRSNHCIFPRKKGLSCRPSSITEMADPHRRHCSRRIEIPRGPRRPSRDFVDPPEHSSSSSSRDLPAEETPSFLRRDSIESTPSDRANRTSPSRLLPLGRPPWWELEMDRWSCSRRVAKKYWACGFQRCRCVRGCGIGYC